MRTVHFIPTVKGLFLDFYWWFFSPSERGPCDLQPWHSGTISCQTEHTVCELPAGRVRLQHLLLCFFFFVFISSLFFANIWLCLTSITDTFEAFTLNLLSSLMITGPNSPFYKALIEPKIGTDFSPVVGFVLCTQIPVKMSWHSAEWHWWCLCVMFCTADMMAAPKKLRSVSASRGCPRRTWRQWKTLSTEP